MQEELQVITEFGIQLVIVALFLYYINDNRKYQRAKEEMLEEERKKQNENFNKLITSKQEQNHELLSQIVTSNQNLSKSQENIAKSLEIIQQSNYKINANLNEHRNNMRDFVNKGR